MKKIAMIGMLLAFAILAVAMVSACGTSVNIKPEGVSESEPAKKLPKMSFTSVAIEIKTIDVVVITKNNNSVNFSIDANARASSVLSGDRYTGYGGSTDDLLETSAKKIIEEILL